MRRVIPLLVIFVSLLATPAFSAGGDVVVVLHDGLASITARDAAVSDVLRAWSRAGGTTIVNGELLRSARLTLQVVDMPEEQALDVVLRSAIGYVARRRSAPAADASAFDRVIVLPRTDVAAPDAPTPTPASAVPLAPLSIDGVEHLIGPDGLPVPDDQEGAPGPGSGGFSRGDEPDGRPETPAPSMPPGQGGVPVPGMIAPAPSQPRPR